MRVLLLDNIRGVGQIGDIKMVKDGYARNFLFPRKLAKLADSRSQKEAETLKSKRTILLQEEQKFAHEAAEKLKDINLQLEGKTNEIGTLFAAIGKKEIIQKIKEKTGIEISAEMIAEHEPIKTTGEHIITLELAPDVRTEIKLLVKGLT